jgi:DHA1 family bicyclomycin/chloramphenicol resistance-like MFS transporter
VTERFIPLRILFVLGALSAFGPLSLDLYLPALPALAADLHGSPALAQLTLTACMVGVAVGQLVVGPVSDRYGRRGPLLIGVGAYAVTSALCAAAPDLGVLIALRLLQGLAGGAGIVIARAVVRDLYDTDAAARVFSLLMLVTGIAPVAAPVLGGQLLHFMPWRGLFLTLCLIGCALLAAAAWAVRDTLPPDARIHGGFRASARQLATVVRDPRFTGFTAVITLASVVLFAYIVMSPFVLQDGYGLSAQGFSFVFAANSVGLVLAGRLGAFLVRRVGPMHTLTVGLVIGLAGSVALTVAAVLAAPLPVLLALLFPTVSSVALILPSATALGLAAHRARAGTASGLMGLAQFGVGGAVGPLASVGGATAVLMAACMAGAAVAAMIIQRLLARQRTAPGEPAEPAGAAPGATPAA